MLKNFVSYQIALQLYAAQKSLSCAAHLKSQLERAAASVALNLAEGNARRTPRERKRFFEIAYASARECQACLALAETTSGPAHALADRVGGAIYRLMRAL